MRPDLKVAVRIEHPQRRRQAPYVVGEVTNQGRTAANELHGWISLEAEKLGPYVPPPSPPRNRTHDLDLKTLMQATTSKTPGNPPPSPRWGVIFRDDQEPNEEFYEAQIYGNERLLPRVVKTFCIRVGIKASGQAKIKHRITFAEGSNEE